MLLISGENYNNKLPDNPLELNVSNLIIVIIDKYAEWACHEHSHANGKNTKANFYSKKKDAKF